MSGVQGGHVGQVYRWATWTRRPAVRVIRGHVCRVYTCVGCTRGRGEAYVDTCTQ